jgi:ABC-2 type transport system ATP-binding protein
MTCGRVLIINSGRVAAADTPQNLRRRLHQSGTILLEIRPPQPREAEKMLGRMECFSRVHMEEAGDGSMRIELEVDDGCPDDPRADLGAMCQQEGWPVRELSRRGISLEDVFSQITRKEEA